MTKASMPFASLIEHEERIRDIYQDLSEKAAQSNIRYFLMLFLNGHKDIIDKLKAYGKREVDFLAGKMESPQSIWATNHLLNDENVDLNSLQSVLLFIAKTEEESVGEFDALIGSTEDPEMKDYLEKVKEEKLSITTKADRLYHDMIESKIS